jgi:hypothetical protein
MDLIDRIGFDTIEKLEAAAPARLAEAIVLQTAGHHLAAIYLCGYAAEMWLGSAYFKILGYAPDQEVEASRRGAALKAAKLRKVKSHASHPLDGWVRLLVEEKPKLKPPAYEPNFARALLAIVDSIGRHWWPHIRYRDIDPGLEIAGEITDSTRWLWNNYPTM